MEDGDDYLNYGNGRDLYLKPSLDSVVASTNEVLQAFLNKGMNVNEKDKLGRRLLSFAIDLYESGDEDKKDERYSKIQILFDNGAKPSSLIALKEWKYYTFYQAGKLSTEYQGPMDTLKS